MTRRSGTSIRGEVPSRAGNKRLKNALFHLAWAASCHDSLWKAYYDQKQAEGKQQNAAVLCLARRQLNVLFAMVKDRGLLRGEDPGCGLTVNVTGC